MSPLALLHFVKNIAQSLAAPSLSLGPRLIDIDILFMTMLFYKVKQLTILHAGDRDCFVLPLLAAIAPDWRSRFG